MDVLGERWALLIVRDLLVGPRRYTDLHRGLPGISTDMLATRLGELERAGVVRRAVLGPPTSAKVYELTELGTSLEPVLHGLAQWGLRRLTGPEYADAPSTDEWIELSLRSAYVAPRGLRRRVRVRFVIDEHDLVATIGPGGLDIERGDAGEVDVEVVGPMQAMVELLLDPTRSRQLFGDGVVTVTGERDDITLALGAFRASPLGG